MWDFYVPPQYFEKFFNRKGEQSSFGNGKWVNNWTDFHFFCKK
jgi:hypothetical protein